MLIPISFSTSSMQKGHATRQAASTSGNEAQSSLSVSRNQCKLELLKHFYIQHVVVPWNGLPAEIQRALSVKDFNVKYDHSHARLSEWLAKEVSKLIHYL